MSSIILWFLALIASLTFLIKSADLFTEYSERLGIRLGISSLIIGATIVAIGTSLPELLSSLFALQAGETSFVVDNIVGSNIANALLILGIGGLVARGLRAKVSLINIELPFFFMSMALFSYFAMDQGISRAEGFVLILFLVVFMVYQLFQKGGKLKEEERSSESVGKLLIVIVLSAIVLSFSAKYLVTSVLTLSELLGISSSILTITVVAFGTSLPEIITSVSAIRMGNPNIAIGNVLGSNTFNLLLIGGIPAIIHPLTISPETFSVGLPFFIIATFIAIFALYDDRVDPWEGLAMVFFYLVFIGKITGVL